MATSTSNTHRTKTARSTISDRERIKEAFLKRSILALQRLAESAGTEELAEALAAPTDVGGMTLLLSEVATLQPECVALDPWAEFLAKGAAVKQDLLREAGGAYTTGQVAELLGITRQAVQQRTRRGTLLALEAGAVERYYPAIQFIDHRVVPGFEQLLAAFNVADPWTRLSVLLDTDESLGGRRVIDALRDGDLDHVLRVVKSYAA